VVATANHFWVDAIAAGVLLALTLAVMRPNQPSEMAGSVGEARVLAG
jgi:hypothetical protein